jgi:OmpA-OmpF porin, OOP family
MLSFFFCRSLFGDQTFRIEYVPGDKYKITQVSNLRRTVNGKYQGITYKQERGILEVVPSGKGRISIEGNYYAFEETKHNTVSISNEVDKVFPVQFSIEPDGEYTVSGSSSYPTLRNFPVFPKEPVAKGGKWREYGIRYVDPNNDGVFTRVRFYCEYAYEGEKEYKGKKYTLITAQYALRYKQGEDPNGDKKLLAITNAGHKIEILFDAARMRPVFMTDLIIENLGGEVYKFADGTTIVIHGFTLTWFDTIEELDRDKVVKEFKDEIVKNDLPDITVEKRDEGVALTLNNIHFVPNKATILPEEKSRLDALYRALKQIKDRTFLVVGHTAKVGTEAEQQELSVQRAKAIVDYLVSKGIEAKRFLYEGRGAREPVAPNDTEENMAKNRRVEIIIMED